MIRYKRDSNLLQPFKEQYALKVWKIIPTNGSVDENGDAIMHEGLAKACAVSYPAVKSVLGALLKKAGNAPYIIGFHNHCHIVSFPIKHHYGDRKADLSLMSHSFLRLKYLVKSVQPNIVVLPRIGCGCGKRSWNAEVKGMVEQFDEDTSPYLLATVVVSNEVENNE